jgi:CRISPR/Cas system endoribonuclease Cas6 (RAMP superfamily)
VDFEKPERMLFAQAQMAANAIDRYDAVKALASKNDEEKMKWFTEWIKTEKAYQVRQEMVRQMAGNKDATDLHAIAVNDENSRVKETLVQGLNPDFGKAHIYALLKDKSYKVSEAALDQIIKNNLPMEESILYGVDGINNAIAVKYYTYLYISQGDETFINKVVEMAGPAFEFRTRINAFDALKAANFMNKQAADNILQASVSYNGRLAAPARNAMAYFKGQLNAAKFFAQ